MTVSVAIGADPKDIENLTTLKEIVNDDKYSHLESVKEWINDLYFILTDYKHFDK